MRVASLVLRVFPAQLQDLKSTVLRVPGVQWHGADPHTGNAIVTVEDGEGYSMADSLIAVSQAPQVQSLTLAYEYTDDGLELQEA